MAKSADRPKRFALYWCTTPDGDEDWFVVAESAATARRFHENAEGYDRGEADAERIAPVPPELVTPEGFQNGAGGKVYRRACWPSDELLIALGGEIAPLPREGLRDAMGVVSKDVRFGDRVFRAGDLVTNYDRERGIKQPRLSVFKGTKSRSAKK